MPSTSTDVGSVCLIGLSVFFLGFICLKDSYTIEVYVDKFPCGSKSFFSVTAIVIIDTDANSE